jgi:hypothetical protein
MGTNKTSCPLLLTGCYIRAVLRFVSGAVNTEEAGPGGARGGGEAYATRYGQGLAVGNPRDLVL